MSDLLTFGNPVFGQFAFYSGIVICKTMAMSLLTSVNRMKNRAFANPEDFKLRGKPGDEGKPVTNATVERIRRCHLNDLENVIPFVLIGLLYVCTKPDPSTALMHFRAFTGLRIFHTFAYLLPLPQPSRALGFLLGAVVTGSMALAVLKAGSY
ncbi:microsomal glutathione S-transferase 1-like [Mytilus californianus]|uniref:microsomal glutathione S-transferase 1-like n=1 Tax=Mytilus californianus TaxID=6549 RepID=UPI002247EFEB|nr:microsomal glutathione S-transferase 1-like [Mytilus californianus]